LLAVCSTAYPTMTINDQVIELWKQMLIDVDAELASLNLKQHIMTSKFPPTIADIARQPARSFYDNDKQLAQKHITMIEDSARTAVPMPEHIRKELLGDDR